ncbi:MAG: hypothetical protein Q4D65_05690 [Peptostreptococcaceae bacterium]|nr:hypothetical protein [Peptostreptococcaceae bacterium]
MKLYEKIPASEAIVVKDAVDIPWMLCIFLLEILSQRSASGRFGV